MTDGRLSLDKENRLLKQLKGLKDQEESSLLPEVEENSIVKLDLKDTRREYSHNTSRSRCRAHEDDRRPCRS